MTSLSLSDAVFSKLQDLSSADQVNSAVDEKVLEVYSKVGFMLSRYKSGKIPKAFKILPKLKNWEYILNITQPELWTPNATYQATKIFVSSLSPKLAEHFFTYILLPKIRRDISQNKKLNSHLYESLKKALYKPAAFFRGIVLGLCDSSDVTLKEASIIASIVSKMTIPVLHSAACLLKLTEEGYSGPRSIFIKALLDKKYALPKRVVDAVTGYFLRFGDNPSDLPVLWHQSLLVFAQRYKHELEQDQRAALITLLTTHHHDQISSEIVRELDQASRNMN